MVYLHNILINNNNIQYNKTYNYLIFILVIINKIWKMGMEYINGQMETYIKDILKMI